MPFLCHALFRTGWRKLGLITCIRHREKHQAIPRTLYPHDPSRFACPCLEIFCKNTEMVSRPARPTPPGCLMSSAPAASE
jgi:hypothetical protein